MEKILGEYKFLKWILRLF